MSNRSDNIRSKLMPNGNIRFYQADKPDKRCVSELQITDPNNISVTVTTAHGGGMLSNISDIQAVRKFRTDEMRERRRLHGDKGDPPPMAFATPSQAY